MITSFFCRQKIFAIQNLCKKSSALDEKLSFSIEIFSKAKSKYFIWFYLNKYQTSSTLIYFFNIILRNFSFVKSFVFSLRLETQYGNGWIWGHKGWIFCELRDKTIYIGKHFHCFISKHLSNVFIFNGFW